MRWLALTLLLVSCASAPPKEPAPPDRPTLPEDVTPAAWNASLQQLMPTLSDCKSRQKSLKSGRVEVEIDVGPTGQPKKVLAFGGVPLPLRECVAAAFRSGRYPVSSRGEYTYVYPINYR